MIYKAIAHVLAFLDNSTLYLLSLLSQKIAQIIFFHIQHKLHRVQTLDSFLGPLFLQKLSSSTSLRVFKVNLRNFSQAGFVKIIQSLPTSVFRLKLSEVRAEWLEREWRLISRLQGLKRLSLRVISQRPRSGFLQQIARLQRLECLTLQNSFGSRLQFCTQIFSRELRLQKLKLVDCCYRHQLDSSPLVNRLKIKSYLDADILGFNDQTFRMIQAIKPKKLQIVDQRVFSQKYISQNAVRVLSHLSLSQLRLTSINTYFFVQEIMDLCMLLQLFSHQLVLRSVAGLTDASLFLAASGPLQKLTELDLSYTTLTDQSISVLSEHLTGVKRISISHCCRVTGRGLKLLLQSVRELEQLSLQNMRQLDQDCLQLIASRNGKSLRLLNLGQNNFQDFQLQSVIKRTTSLRVLKLRRMNKKFKFAFLALQGFRVQYLDLSHCHLKQADLHLVLACCKPARLKLLPHVFIHPESPQSQNLQELQAHTTMSKEQLLDKFMRLRVLRGTGPLKGKGKRKLLIMDSATNQQRLI